jgi:hypothetical protein
MREKVLSKDEGLRDNNKNLWFIVSFVIILSYHFILPITSNNIKILFGEVDPTERYIVYLIRNEKEEQFISIEKLPHQEIIYTTQGQKRFITAITCLGQKVAYIGYEGIRYLYQLDSPKYPYTIKVFIFDLITKEEKELNITNKNIDPDIIESCGNDTVILFELGEEIGNYTIIWYSLSKFEKIKEVSINLQGYNFESYYRQGARLFYCSPDHRQVLIRTYRKGPRFPWTGYLPAPVPIISLFEEGKERLLIDPEKEWLINPNIIKLCDRIIMTIVTNKFNDIYLIQLSFEGEIYRKRLNIRELKIKGYKSLEFLNLSNDGKYIYCYDYNKRQILKWNINNNQLTILFTNVKNLEILPIKSDKLWIRLNDQQIYKLE